MVSEAPRQYWRAVKIAWPDAAAWQEIRTGAGFLLLLVGLVAFFGLLIAAGPENWGALR
ncbi:MAG: hypothetical protein HYY02_05305 [Chloroflexi bacterium]|nr:hypothetical protein [Chloroflexota bacterium]